MSYSRFNRYVKGAPRQRLHPSAYYWLRMLVRRLPEGGAALRQAVFGDSRWGAVRLTESTFNQADTLRQRLAAVKRLFPTDKRTSRPFSDSTRHRIRRSVGELRVLSEAPLVTAERVALHRRLSQPTGGDPRPSLGPRVTGERTCLPKAPASIDFLDPKDLFKRERERRRVRNEGIIDGVRREVQGPTSP